MVYDLCCCVRFWDFKVWYGDVDAFQGNDCVVHIGYLLFFVEMCFRVLYVWSPGCTKYGRNIYVLPESRVKWGFDKLVKLA